MPPETVTSIEPLLPPVHETLTCVSLATSAAGCEIVAPTFARQPCASVTISV